MPLAPLPPLMTPCLVCRTREGDFRSHGRCSGCSSICICCRQPAERFYGGVGTCCYGIVKRQYTGRAVEERVCIDCGRRGPGSRFPRCIPCQIEHRAERRD
jgi:hypothetical protein